MDSGIMRPYIKNRKWRQRIAQHSRPLATYLIHLKRWTHITVSLIVSALVSLFIKNAKNNTVLRVASDFGA